MWNSMEALLQKAIEEGMFPGCAFVSGAGERVICTKTMGTLDHSGRMVNESTRYDLGFLTSILTVVPLCLLALEEGRITLNDTLSLWFDNVPQDKSDITIRQLLTHTSGFTSHFLLSEHIRRPADTLNCILDFPLRSFSESRPKDNAIDSLLLGLVLEKEYGMSIDQLVKKYVTIPLSLLETGYLPTGSNIAPSFSQSAGRESNEGQPRDENARFLHGVSGHAGLFSSITDLKSYLSVLTNGGLRGNSAYLCEASVSLLYKNAARNFNAARSLGFHITSENDSQLGALWPYGAAVLTDDACGSMVAVEPQSGFYIALLCNGSFDALMRSEMRRFHQQLSNAAYAAWQKGRNR